MPDLSKHLSRAKQAYEKGGCDMAIEILSECVDVDPTNVEIYRILLPVARRKAKETSGKTSIFGSFKVPTFSNDPHKQFASAIKQLSKSGDAKTIADAMESAAKLSASMKGMSDVVIFLGEEFRATGMFNDRVLWILGNHFYERFKASGNKDPDALDRAIKALSDLEKNMPSHPEAGRTVKNWMALRAGLVRSTAGGGSTGDFRGQVVNVDAARRQEMINRIIRTPEEAREILRFLDEDLQKSPGDKFLWTKKGDLHVRIRELTQARQAYEKAQAIDQHDFTISIKLGDVRIAEIRMKLEALPPDSPELLAGKRQLLDIEITEYRQRVERQPTDMGHRFNLGQRLYDINEIDAAAAEFQRSVNDPRLRKGSHRYLGLCFTRKNLLDLAITQYKLFLPLVDDELSNEAKDGRYQLARLYENRGNNAEAIVEFEKLVALDLSFRDAADRLSKLRGA